MIYQRITAPLIFLLFIPLFSLSQSFEGKLTYMNYYLDSQSYKPLFDGIREVVFISKHFQKNDVEGEGSGGLDWAIYDFKSAYVYSKRRYENAPVVRHAFCSQAVDSNSIIKVIDTTIMVAGLPSKVAVELVNGFRIAEYYYCDSIRVSPLQYKCNRDDGLHRIYRFTKGALITQWIQFGDYVAVYQLQEIERMKVDLKEFEIPKDLRIVNSDQ